MSLTLALNMANEQSCSRYQKQLSTLMLSQIAERLPEPSALKIDEIDEPLVGLGQGLSRGIICAKCGLGNWTANDMNWWKKNIYVRFRLTPTVRNICCKHEDTFDILRSFDGNGSETVGLSEGLGRDYKTTILRCGGCEFKTENRR